MWQRNQSFIHCIQQAVSTAEVFACYNQGNSSLQTLKETRPWICNIVQVKQNMKFPIWNTNSRDSRLAQCSCKSGKKGWVIINSNYLDLTTTDQWQKRTLGYISPYSLHLSHWKKNKAQAVKYCCLPTMLRRVQKFYVQALVELLISIQLRLKKLKEKFLIRLPFSLPFSCHMTCLPLK